MDPDVLGTLIDLGLTNSEARVYIAATSISGGTAREIAAAAEKERGNTYHILQKLSRLGVVEATIVSPTMFRPVPLAEAMNHLFSLQSMKLQQLDEKRKVVASSLSRADPRSSASQETYSIIKGRVNTYLKMVQALQSSRQQVSLLLSAGGLTRVRRFRNFFHAAKQKAEEGTEFRIITEIKSSNLGDVKAFSGFCDLRHVRNQATNASVYDGRVASVALSISERLEEDIKEHVALWTNGRSFVKTISNYFDSVWFVAAPSEPTIASLGAE